MHVYLPSFNVEIFDGPVQSIEAVEYLDNGGNWIAVDPASYRVALRSQPVRVFPVAGFSWPIGRGGPESVRVKAILGMGATRDDIDPAIVQAIHMLTADFLENRGDAAQKGVGFHSGAEALLSPHRAWF